jgi:hypothetical protein
MPELPRIYFDTNSADEDFRYKLDMVGSLRDIKRLGDVLRPGIRVLLYMPDEVEVEATLEFDEAQHRWLGRPDWDTVHLSAMIRSFRKTPPDQRMGGRLAWTNLGASCPWFYLASFAAPENG